MKVQTALTNLFLGHSKTTILDPSPTPISIEGNGPSSLERFRMVIQRDRIRAAAHSVLRKGIDGNRIVFFLNKQVAYAGHVSFCEPEGESPLGPIRVVIDADNPERVIDWITGGFAEQRGKR